MTKYYVRIISPMDCGFIGPFESSNAAHDWCYKYNHTNSTHSGDVMTETEYNRNVDEYGPPDYVDTPWAW